MINLKGLIKSKARFFIGLIFLTLVFNTSIKLIFFSASKEIVYDYKPNMFICKENRRCSFSSTLRLANTGSKNIHELKISMPNMPKTIFSSYRFLNLSSAQPRLHDPSMSDNHSEENRIITLKDLSPGVLVDVDLNGSFTPLKINSESIYFSPSLHADARIHEGSPRGTVFSRIFSILLWF